jgi:hypothetical protein
MRPGDEVLRLVCDPMPAPVERAWRAYDRIQERINFLQRHPLSTEAAEAEFVTDLLGAAFGDAEPVWPSPVDVLAARQNVEARQIELKALTGDGDGVLISNLGARDRAERRISHEIVRSEAQLVETLDDLLGVLQDESALHKAAQAVPLGVGGDGLLRAGPDTASAAALLGDAAGRFEQLKAARRVIFDHVHPTTAPWLDVIAEGMENGATWTSEHVRGEPEPPPWTGGPGGELHYAIVTGVRLRCLTAAQLDEAGYPAPGIYLQTIRA